MTQQATTTYAHTHYVHRVPCESHQSRFPRRPCRAPGRAEADRQAVVAAVDVSCWLCNVHSLWFHERSEAGARPWVKASGVPPSVSPSLPPSVSPSLPLSISLSLPLTLSLSLTLLLSLSNFLSLSLSLWIYIYIPSYLNSVYCGERGFLHSHSLFLSYPISLYLPFSPYLLISFSVLSPRCYLISDVYLVVNHLMTLLTRDPRILLNRYGTANVVVVQIS